MSKIDWSILGAIPKGLAVEGEDDKKVIEAFLDGGEKTGHWSNWRNQLRVEGVGNSSKVLNELKAGDNRIWGLIDRDWRTDAEVLAMQTDYSQLLVLPRVTIENYCINPDELALMLPPAKRIPTLKTDIEVYKDEWLQHGALWQTLWERGAFQFCGGHVDGYPMALLHSPVINETDIKSQYQSWHSKLEITDLLTAYRMKALDFRSNSAQNYSRHIHGKFFFNQIIVAKVLNRKGVKPQTGNKWFSDLFSNVSDCTADLIPILQRIVS
jgi:hypothetical protein